MFSVADLYYWIRTEQPFLVESVSDSLGAHEVPALYHAGNTVELQNGTKLCWCPTAMGFKNTSKTPYITFLLMCSAFKWSVGLSTALCG